VGALKESSMDRYKELNLLGILGLLALSLLLHGLILLALEIGAKYWAEFNPRRTVIEPLELTYAPSSQIQQFVPDTGAAPQEENSKAPARFTSLSRQRVEVETQAVHKDYRGRTENRPQSSPAPKSADSNRSTTKAAKQGANLKPNFWGMVTPEDPAISYGPASSLQLPKVSSLSVDVPRDVQLGNITVLNTDPMRHYSFFERFNRLSYHHWVHEVNSSYLRNTRRGHLIRSGTYSTVVGVILDRNGKVIESQIHSRSGMADFDDAFPRAMRITGQIPNPPEELIEPDGKVRVRLLVTVTVDSPYHSRN
jgi:TonB family protein